MQLGFKAAAYAKPKPGKRKKAEAQMEQAVVGFITVAVLVAFIACVFYSVYGAGAQNAVTPRRRPGAKVPEAATPVPKSAPKSPEIIKFEGAALPIIQEYIFQHYEQYAASKLTFRDMKEHLTGPLGMSYEQLKRDEYSAVVEDAVDAISNQCDGGKVPREDCMAKFGIQEAVREL